MMNTAVTVCNIHIPRKEDANNDNILEDGLAMTGSQGSSNLYLTAYRRSQQHRR
jgi:hypothetical protein